MTWGSCAECGDSGFFEGRFCSESCRNKQSKRLAEQSPPSSKDHLTVGVKPKSIDNLSVGIRYCHECGASFLSGGLSLFCKECIEKLTTKPAVKVVTPKKVRILKTKKQELEKACQGCSKVFVTSSKLKRFCEAACRNRFFAKKTYQDRRAKAQCKVCKDPTVGNHVYCPVCEKKR